jgi:IS5 family transposase
MVELRWDEVGEKYETLKDRVVGWATTRTEKKEDWWRWTWMRWKSRRKKIGGRK